MTRIAGASNTSPMSHQRPGSYAHSFKVETSFFFFLASQNDALSAALSPPRSRNPSSSVDNNPSKEEELDLLYDPCLNCYFDPRTHKYYELA